MDWTTLIVLFALAFITTTIGFNLGMAMGKKRGEDIGFLSGWQSYEKTMLPLMVDSAKTMAVTEYIIEQAESKEK